jgi:TonB-linked SusC/RagA family outer membrane protein
MKKRLLGITVFLFMLSASVMAQTVTGRVTQGADGSPLPGVSVLVKSTTVGTTTDTDGRYTINVPDASAVLVVSFIGFASQEIEVGSRSVIDVALAEDITQLGEVVVTALGIARETKTLVYATQSVKASQLTEVRDPGNILNSFQGKIAGALISQGSGGPGSGSKIVLRGNRSIQGSNNALIVVDGVPINNNTSNSAGSDFGGYQSSDGVSNINPDDIESVTVLRGASAAALYGSQAGNGVIVITTKKGSSDKVSVNVMSVVTADKVFALPVDPQNSYGQGNNGILNPTTGASWGAKLDGSSYTDFLGNQASYSAQPDNIKDFYRTGINLNNSISVQGGSEKMTTYLSYTNLNTKGIIEGNDLLRHTVNLRMTNQISKRFSTDAKITYTSQTIEGKQLNGESNNAPFNILQIPRNLSLSQAKQFETVNNVGVPEPNPYPSTLASIYQNPYWVLNRYSNQEDRERLMGFMSAKFKLTDWLSIQGRANLDKYTDIIEETAYDKTLLWGKPGGNFSVTNIVNTQQWYDVMLEGENRLSSDLKINYRIGAIYFDTKNDQTFNTAGGLNVTNKFSLNFATAPAFSTSFVQVQTQSAFAQANLAWKESIFVDLSFRNDWDSRLPKPYSYPYYSAGVSGIISDLIVLPTAISFLKASVNYAEVGNGGQPQVRFNTYGYSQGAGNGFISRGTTLAIENLKPEIVKNFEIGLDAKFMENRLGFTVTYYDSHSFNQLLQLSLPPATGYYNKYINAGDIQNKGIEVVLNATPVKGNLTWDVAFNLGMNRSKVVKLDKDVKQFLLGGGFSRSATPVVKEGGAFGDLLAFKWQRDDQGNFVVDGTTGLPIITKEQEYIGNFNPKAILGLTNTFDYKRFNVRLLVDGRAGGIIVSGSEMNLAYSGIPEETAKNRETPWNLGGVNATADPETGIFSGGSPVNKPVVAQAFWQATTGGRYGNGEFFAYDATNFRVRELSVGYSIPVPANFLIRSARVSVVARNLFFLYRGSSILDIPGLGKRKMTFDPDMAISNNNFQGVSYGAFPSTRSIGFNVNLSF